MERNSNGSKIKGGADGAGDGEGTIVLKRTQHVTMGMVPMDVLDYPVCFAPLSPPIFQCSLGHFVCSPCRDKLPGKLKACGACSRPVSDRCHGMELVVTSVIVPCPYAMYGCTANAIAYHEMAAHEAVCPHAPCFCPEKGCGFAGTTAALVDNFTARHKWPLTTFTYYWPFHVPVKAGVHVLYEEDDGIFLLYMSSLESPTHEISLVRVQPLHEPKSRFGCFSYFHHYEELMLDTIQSTSLSDGLPTDYVCTVSEPCLGGDDVLLMITLNTEMESADNHELEKEEDDNESYDNEEEDDDDDESNDDEEDKEEDNDDSESYDNEEEDDDDDSDDDEEEDDDDGEWR